MPKPSIRETFERQHGLAGIVQQIPSLSNQAFANPDNAGAWANLGVALRCAGKLPAAIALYRRALAMQPDSPTILSNLGGALRAACQLDEAIHHLQRARDLAPDLAAASFNLGLALEDAGRLVEALECYEKALDLEPQRADAAAQKAFTLLRMGRLVEGFEAYEKRLQFEPMLQRNFKKPAWDGSNFEGKTLLLHSEQGRGDTLQFIRYAPMVKERGGTGIVIVECPPDLMDLVQCVPGVDAVVPQGKPLPAFDYHASLMSLPYIFKTTLATIPQTMPYLTVPIAAKGTIKIKQSSLRKVGIVWSSGHEDIGAHNRSINLEHFLPLLSVPDVALYSLQVGPAVEQITALGCDHLIQNLGRHFKDFANTADAISQLDLIISVDTAVIHLAGALDRPVWILLPYTSEWRWLRDRTDTPWYPTAVLYRQKAPLEWHQVFDLVRHDLLKQVASR